MTALDYFLSCEESYPKELVRQTVRAEAAGFERLWISDHFHPWSDQQGHSPFGWSVIGALSQACSSPITTAVTLPDHADPPRGDRAGGSDVRRRA